MDVPYRHAIIDSLEIVASTSDRAIDFTVLFPDDVLDAGLVTELADRFVATVRAGLANPGRSIRDIVDDGSVA